MGFHTITLLMLGTSLLLCGCAGADAPASNDRPIATQAPTGKPVPAESAEADVTDPVASFPTSWDQRVRLMAKEDAAYLDAVKNRYFGAVAYNSEQERRYLEEAGFPSIEDWLDARKTSDRELWQKADAGDGKAMAFYMDRMIERATPYLHLRGTDDTAYEASPAASYALQAYEFSTQIQSANSSAFTGYLLGATFSMLSYPQSPEAAAAGMMAARNAGDPRADALLGEYQAEHPGLNQSEVLAILRSMEPSQ